MKAEDKNPTPDAAEKEAEENATKCIGRSKGGCRDA